MQYFTSADMDQSAAESGELHGALMVGPMPVLEGRTDRHGTRPPGIIFPLFEGEVDP